jgi:hypothetical protein
MAETWLFNPGRPCCVEPEPPLTPGCPCPDGPGVIYMKSTRPDLNSELFQDATLRYIATPAPYAPLLLGTHGYYSDEEFIERGHGDVYRYFLACDPAAYGLHRVFVESSFGSPLIDLRRYTWTAGVRGNTCDPFYYLGGTIYPGGNPAGKVYLSEFSGDWKLGSKWVVFNVFRGTAANPLDGVTVSLGGQSGVSDASGFVGLTIPQSATDRTWTATKAGYLPASGVLAGETPVATEAQGTTLPVNMTIAP